MNVKLAVPPREILQLPRRNKTALGPGDRLRPLSKFLNKLKIVENIPPKNEQNKIECLWLRLWSPSEQAQTDVLAEPPSHRKLAKTYIIWTIIQI